jgi:hypothetical protein
MSDSPRVPFPIRYPAAFALAFFDAWILLVFASDLAFVKAIHGDSILFPSSYTAQFTLKRMALALALAAPALYLSDWLLKSRTQLALLSLLALAVAVWIS